MPPVASSISWPLHLRPSEWRYVSRRCSNFWATCIGFMIPDATPYNECYSAPYQLHALDALGYQGAGPELRPFCVFGLVSWRVPAQLSRMGAIHRGASLSSTTSCSADGLPWDRRYRRFRAL